MNSSQENVTVRLTLSPQFVRQLDWLEVIYLGQAQL